MGQGGGEDAVTLTLARRGGDGEDWEREVRRVTALRAGGHGLPGALSPALSGRIGAKRGGGQPLDATVRRGMEGVFQVSFGHVRIHADGEADVLNRGVAAIAFTVGSDIFFRAGAYQPHSAAGQHLLAHELAHVVQQRTGSLGSSGGGTMTVGAADDRHEQEAEATAHRVTAALQARGQALTAPAASSGAAFSRQYDPALALIAAPVGVARATAPTPQAAKDRPTPPGSPALPLRTPSYAFVLADAANLHAVAPTPGDTLAAAPVIGQLPVTAKLQVLQADPARDRALVRVLAAPAAAKALVGKEGWVRLSFLDARWPAGDPDATMYVIRGGDTALGLAARFYGLPASAHPEQDADLRRYVQALVLANRAPACWIDRPNPANPLDWMRAQVNANARLWVPTRAKADALAATVRSPSLTGGAWATVARGLGWAEAHLLQGASLYAQDVVVLADAAASAVTGATRYAIMIGGTAARRSPSRRARLTRRRRCSRRWRPRPSRPTL